MTREEARKAAEVMMAYADGKNIESRIVGEDEFNLCIGNTGFNFTNYEYRIKKEPTYRPFKDKEECWNEMPKHQPFGWLRSKQWGSYSSIGTVGNGNGGGLIIRSSDECHRDSMFAMYNEYTFADGTPFGIKEE